MRGNIITLHMERGKTTRSEEALFQYDYGQKVVLEGIELPSAYEVHFSNDDIGNSKTVIGDETGVDIPDEYLTTGKIIHVWVYLHDGENDGETECHGIIGVMKRSKPTNQEPTPVQQDVITQTIAALDAAVDEAEAIAESIPERLDAAFGEITAEAETLVPGSSATATFDAETKTLAIGVPKGETGDDGISPSASVNKSGSVATFTVTDKDGTTSVEIRDGKDGEASIDDTAGAGDTDKIWSASKTVSELNTKLNVSQKGSANGVAELDENGLIPSAQLPSYVDDILEFEDTEHFPETGESGKIYVALDTNLTYRWGGSAYVFVGSSLALGETSSTAYRGDRGKAAYEAAVVNPDVVPTEDSANLVKSGGVYNELALKAPKANPVFTGSISLGRKANTTVGSNSVAEGYDVTASGNYSYAEGGGTTASGNLSHAEGAGTTASGSQSHAEGGGTTASGENSHAEGGGSQATAGQAHAEGSGTKASGGSSHAEGGSTEASGAYSHAEGSTAKAYATASHAEGAGTIASGLNSHAEDGYTTASGDYSHAEGAGTTASGNYSHAEGGGTIASGNCSHAEGSSTTAIGANEHVSGTYNVLDTADTWIANTSYAVGAVVKREESYVDSSNVTRNVTVIYKCKTANSDATFNNSKWTNYGQYLFVVGNGTGSSTRSNAYALDWDGNERLMGDVYVGCNANSTGGTKVAKVTDIPDPASIIDDTAGDGDTDKTWSADKLVDQFDLKAPKANPVFTGSISMGRTANSTVGSESTAFGISLISSGYQSHAEGAGTIASNSQSHAEGYNTTASNFQSHAEGAYTIASGEHSHAEGRGGTFAIGGTTYTSEAKGFADHTEGYMCLTASGQPGNHAEGFQTRATGGAAHAEGNVTFASGGSAHAEGSQTIASGAQSHAEGLGTTASAAQSHAEGYNTTASNFQSHAEGAYTIASGLNSHAEGGNTIASGLNSHVFGTYNIEDSYANWPEWVSGTLYHVGDKVKITTGETGSEVYTGYTCKTENSDVSFTSSKWNSGVAMNYVEIVGNGTVQARSNARTLDWNGNERLKGDIYVGCNADSSGGYKVARLIDIPSGGNVSDVQINGTSILNNGVANILVATTTETQAIISEYGVSA